MSWSIALLLVVFVGMILFAVFCIGRAYQVHCEVDRLLEAEPEPKIPEPWAASYERGWVSDRVGSLVHEETGARIVSNGSKYDLTMPDGQFIPDAAWDLSTAKYVACRRIAELREFQLL